MQVPAFDMAWHQFLHDWCLDCPLGYGFHDVARAFRALQRHLPEQLHDRLASTGRGVGIVVPLIDLGALLADCDAFQGFQQTLRRLQKKLERRSAYSELVVAQSVTQLGYT